jgi:adenylate cyclase
VIFAYEGTVAKVIGDAIHVLFNAPGDQPDHAARGIACACALDAWAQDFRERWKAKSIAFGVTRIGLHAGPALVGNFGGERLFDYAAYGDTINTAARLEAANKLLGTRICISGAVAAGATDFIGRPIGDLVLRGRSETLKAYEPLTREAFSSPLTARYSDAFGRLSAEDPSVMPVFAALFGEQPDDPLAGFHLRRLLNGEKGTRIEVA